MEWKQIQGADGYPPETAQRHSSQASPDSLLRTPFTFPLLSELCESHNPEILEWTKLDYPLLEVK